MKFNILVLFWKSHLEAEILKNLMIIKVNFNIKVCCGLSFELTHQGSSTEGS